MERLQRCDRRRLEVYALFEMKSLRILSFASVCFTPALNGVCCIQRIAVGRFSSSELIRQNVFLRSSKHLYRLYVESISIVCLNLVSASHVSNSSTKPTPSKRPSLMPRRKITTDNPTHEHHGNPKTENIACPSTPTGKGENHAKLQNKLATNPTDQPAKTATLAAPEGTFPAAAPPM